MASGSYWPEASAKFTADTYFAGGDGGGSIDLGGGRVLWSFGDSFIRTSPGQARSASKLIRNSVAIQSGSYDLSQATMTFYCGGGGGLGSASPASFFPERAVGGGPIWNWMTGGIRIDDVLLLILLREENYPAGPPGFNFAQAGWDAILVDNPDDPPSSWTFNYIPTPSETTFSPLQPQEGGDGHIYMVGVGPNDVFRMIRWDREAVKAGQLLDPDRWGRCGWEKWARQGPWRDIYAAGINQGSFWMRQNDFALVQLPFTSAGTFGYSLNSARVGPYGPLTGFYSPFTDDPNMPLPHSKYFLYLGGAHPEQVWPGQQQGDVMLTYVAGAQGGNSVFVDENTYYVRCAKAIGLV